MSMSPRAGHGSNGSARFQREAVLAKETAAVRVRLVFRPRRPRTRGLLELRDDAGRLASRDTTVTRYGYDTPYW